MIIDTNANVKGEVTADTMGWGVFRTAYETTLFATCMDQAAAHVTSGAKAGGCKVVYTFTDDHTEQARALVGKGFSMFHLTSVKADPPKANYVFTSNVVSVDKVYAKEKTGRKVDLFWGTGVSTSQDTAYLHRHFIEIDGMPKDEQADLVDHLHSTYGLPYPSDGTDSGTAFGICGVDDPDAVAGKSLHLGWNGYDTTEEDWKYHQKALVVMFTSDPACVATSWRMRFPGCMAKYAGDEEVAKHRAQRWFYKDSRLDRGFKDLYGAIDEYVGSQGINVEMRFSALQWVQKLTGRCTTLKRRAETAATAGCIEGAFECDMLRSQVEAEREDLLRGKLADSTTEQLYRVSWETGRKYDPQVKAQNVKPVKPFQVSGSEIPQNGTPVKKPVMPTDVTGGSEMAGDAADYLSDGWDFDTRKFIVKRSGELVAGTALELYEVHGNKNRQLVSGVYCPVCGKAARAGDPKCSPSAMLSIHPDKRGASLKCASCGALVKSARPTASKARGQVAVRSQYYRERDLTATEYVPQFKRLKGALGKGAYIEDVSSQTWLPADLPIRRKQVFIVTPQGRGKTTWLVSLAASNPAMKILVVVPTQCLADSAFGRLQPHGFTLYNDDSVDPELFEDRLVCCLDSIPRVGWGAQYDVVIIEEGHSTLGRFNDTQMRNRPTVWKSLKDLCHDAGHVVVMDAGLTEGDLLTTSSLTGTDLGDSQLVYMRTQRNTTVKVHSTLEDLLLSIPEDASVGATFIYSNTRSDAETVYSRLPANARKLLIDAMTGGEAEVIELMRDPNKLVSQYDFIVASPSMGSGVDISTTHFAHVRVIARTGDFSDAQGVMQGIYRVRSCPDVQVWLDDKRAGCNEDPEYWRSRMRVKAAQEIKAATLAGARCGNSFEFIALAPRDPDEDFIEARVRANVEHAVSANNQKAWVLAMLKEQGVKVRKTRKAPKAERRVLKKLYTEQKQAVRKAEYAAKADAVPITMDAAGKLERKRKCTREQRYQVARAKIVDVLGDSVDISPELVAAWETDDLRAKVYRYAAVEACLKGNTGTFAATRFKTYSNDATQAENGNVLEAVATTRVLREVYGIESLLTLGTIDLPDDAHLEVLKTLSEDPEVRAGVKFNEHSVDRPLRFLQDLLRRVGIESDVTDRVQVDGVRKYRKLATDEKTVKQMGELTLKQRMEYEPYAEPSWVRTTGWEWVNGMSQDEPMRVGSDDGAVPDTQVAQEPSPPPATTARTVWSPRRTRTKRSGSCVPS